MANEIIYDKKIPTYKKGFIFGDYAKEA